MVGELRDEIAGLVRRDEHVEAIEAESSRASMIDAHALDDRTSVITLHGRANLALSRDLQLAVLEGAHSGRTRIVIDMSDVARVDPGVLGALLRLRRLLLAMGGGLALVSLRPAAELFGVAVSDQLLGRAASVEQAVGLIH